MMARFLSIVLFVILSRPCWADITIVLPDSRKQDAGYSLATERLSEALQSTGRKAEVRFLTPDSPLPAGDLIVVGRMSNLPGEAFKPAKTDGFKISSISMPGRRLILIEGDERGLMYGLFRLAERIRIGESPWAVAMQSEPAFAMRMFSEEGQILSLPDFGYYSEQSPYVDEKRLRKEIDEAKRLIDAVVPLGFNAVTWLHVGLEDYIDYRHLDKPVYAPGDRHLTRSPVFCRYLKELCDYAHARHIDIYLQLYELQYPPKLGELYDIQLKSPDFERIVRAKTRELFERVPLDGLVVTATEAHPRCGYRSAQLWRGGGLAGAGQMLTLYHEACKASGKKAIFRLWRVSSKADTFREITRRIPPDAMLAMKNTGGDYYLNSAPTDLITSGAAGKHPTMILFDTFREFDGWSRLFVFMKRWGEIVRACRDNGVQAINAWGPWCPGCIWPDWEPGYMADGKRRRQKVKVSWVGRWNQFRMFTRGFSPGQANVYLLGRLMWNPDVDVASIARDFVALHVGPDNADAAAEALMATEDAWAEEYVKGAHPCYLKWTMVFGPREVFMRKALQNNTLEEILSSNARGLEHVDRMQKAFAKTRPAKASDPTRYAEFKKGIDKTALYLRTFYLWRQCQWRHHAMNKLAGDAKKANAEALQADKASLMKLFDQWQRWPEEAAHWRITFRYGRYKVSPDETCPTWYTCGEKTMESTARRFY